MLNKALIDKMLEMPDDKLLVMLKIVMAGAGADTSGKTMSRLDPKTLRKLRGVLKEITDDDLVRIAELTEVYKNGI